MFVVSVQTGVGLSGEDFNVSNMVLDTFAKVTMEVISDPNPTPCAAEIHPLSRRHTAAGAFFMPLPPADNTLRVPVQSRKGLGHQHPVVGYRTRLRCRGSSGHLPVLFTRLLTFLFLIYLYY